MTGENERYEKIRKGENKRTEIRKEKRERRGEQQIGSKAKEKRRYKKEE